MKTYFPAPTEHFCRGTLESAFQSGLRPQPLVFGGRRKHRRLIARKISGPLDSSQPRTPVKGPVEINCIARQPLSSESASGDGKRRSVPGTAHELDRLQGHTSHPWHSLEKQEEKSKHRET